MIGFALHLPGRHYVYGECQILEFHVEHRYIRIKASNRRNIVPVIYSSNIVPVVITLQGSLGPHESVCKYKTKQFYKYACTTHLRTF